MLGKLIGKIIEKIKGDKQQWQGAKNLKFGCIPDTSDGSRDYIWEVERDLSNTKCGYYQDRY